MMQLSGSSSQVEVRHGPPWHRRPGPVTPAPATTNTSAKSYQMPPCMTIVRHKDILPTRTQPSWPLTLYLRQLALTELSAVTRLLRMYDFTLCPEP